MALIFSLGLTVHMAVAPLAPIADGAGYATRTFALYGYLHTGQWHSFWELLVRPRQSIFPLHDLAFFALPQAFAGAGTYLALQNFTTYFLLAFGVWRLASLFHRPQWAPAIFVLIAANNVAFTDFYAFYLDMPFLAFGLLVIALQMEAWVATEWQAGLWAGMSLGLLFFLKPANALVFLSTFVLAELFHALPGLRAKSAEMLGLILKRWSWIALGFMPVLGAALWCGAAQSILLLIDQNEVHEGVNPLAVAGLLRLFYFPLCLSAYYHVALLTGLFLVTFVAGRWLVPRELEKGSDRFAWQLLCPVLLAYMMFGLFFSFWMLDKPMRSLLLVLPLFWMVFFRVWEQGGVGVRPLFGVALVYAALIFCQKEFNIFKSQGQILEDNYQLTAASWSEFPAAWRTGASLNQVICDLVSRHLPPRAVICINAIELRNSLGWRLGNRDLLLGQTPHYEVRNIFNYKGAYYKQSLAGADLLVLITFYPTQASKISWMEAGEVLDYASAKWAGAAGVARMFELPRIKNQALGYEVRFVRPLDEAAVEKANAATFGNMHPLDGYGVESIEGRHYSYAEARALLRAWAEERF